MHLKYMMLTNFNIFGFGDLKLVFLQIGWSYLDTSGTQGYGTIYIIVLLNINSTRCSGLNELLGLFRHESTWGSQNL